ncbi:hypothetical protein JCM8208_003668 [Rhodotorula glutinis]
MSAVFSPFRRGAAFIQRSAHESPPVFWAIVLGALGPAMVLTVPEARKRFFGYKQAERAPTTYPLPNRPREAVEGYEDGWKLKA